MNSTSKWSEKWYLDNKDNRTHFRVSMCTPIYDLRLSGHTIENQNNLISPGTCLIDISEEGIGLKTYNEIEIGTVISFRLKLHSVLYSFDCEARIVRISILDDAIYIGAMFINLSSIEKKNIKDFVNKEFIRQF